MSRRLHDPGTVYLLHFIDPATGESARYRHAGHYTGWALDLATRLARHEDGRGARLLEVIRDAGLGWKLARTWPGDRRRERQIKNQGGASRHCPECGVRPREDALPVNADGSLSRSRTTDAQKHAAGVMTSTQQAEHTALRQGAYGRIAAEDRGRIRRAAALSTDAVPGRDDLWTGRPAGTPPGFQAGSETRPAGALTRKQPVPEKGNEKENTMTSSPAAGPGYRADRDARAREDPARAGAITAQQIISAQAAAGMNADRIAAHHQEVSASLLSGADTEDGHAFAREYDTTGEALLADLREMQRGPEPDRTPGAPHPDARLAARGWRNCQHGIYVRHQAQAEADSDPEAA